MRMIEKPISARTHSSGNRQAYLDHIRVYLTVTVIMLHAAITYGAMGGWYCNEDLNCQRRDSSPKVKNGSLSQMEQLGYLLFGSVNQAYFMGFFFLIAGYFTPSSLRRKGASAFLRDRFIRLGIPLAVFALVLSPLTISLSRLLVKGGTIFDGFYWVYVMHHYECGPLWFVQALLIFSVIYVAWAKFFPAKTTSDNAPLPSHLWLYVAAMATGIAAFLIRLEIPVGRNILCMQLGYFATYVVLFYVGCRAARSRWLERVEWSHAMPWVAATFIAIFALPMVGNLCHDGAQFTGGWNVVALFYSMWEPFVAWGVILGLLYATQKYLSGTNPFMAGLARGSFAVYCIHAPVLVGLTVLAHGWVADPMEKWLVVGLGTCVVSWTIAAVLVRLPGVKRVL